jgi:hypothetical protein
LTQDLGEGETWLCRSKKSQGEGYVKVNPWLCRSDQNLFWLFFKMIFF